MINKIIGISDQITRFWKGETSEYPKVNNIPNDVIKHIGAIKSINNLINDEIFGPVSREIIKAADQLIDEWGASGEEIQKSIRESISDDEVDPVRLFASVIDGLTLHLSTFSNDQTLNFISKVSRGSKSAGMVIKLICYPQLLKLFHILRHNQNIDDAVDLIKDIKISIDTPTLYEEFLLALPICQDLLKVYADTNEEEKPDLIRSLEYSKSFVKDRYELSYNHVSEICDRIRKFESLVFNHVRSHIEKTSLVKAHHRLIYELIYHLSIIEKNDMSTFSPNRSLDELMLDEVMVWGVDLIHHKKIYLSMQGFTTADWSWKFSEHTSCRYNLDIFSQELVIAGDSLMRLEDHLK